MWFLLRLSIFVAIFHHSACELVDAVDEVDNDRAQIEGKSYLGAQLWRIPYSDRDYKNAISELQNTYHTTMWNLQMANASNAFVDMFVKQAVVDDAREFLKKAQIPFEVIIEDVQDAIDTENPPLDEIDLWQNRDGE